MKKRLLMTLMGFAVAGLGLMSCAQVRENNPAVDQPKELTLDCGNSVSMKLVLIPAGEFIMGGDETPEQVARKCNNPNAKAEWFQNEQPQHRVKITKPFYMGTCEVTQAQYETVMEVNPSYFKGESNPAEQVLWNEAVEFCKKLSLKTGQKVRLPTEAEWEYACRAGTTTPFFSGGTISTDQANYRGDYPYGDGRIGEYRQKTVAVGSFAPNGFGLYDMDGNVLQWCQDWYGPYPSAEMVDPVGLENGKSHVLRGGSWGDYAAFCRSARRFTDGGGREIRFFLVGFRVVCAPKP